MKKTILFVILDNFSDWESTYVSTFISALGQDKYEIKTVSLTKNPVKTLGGFTVVPDYDVESAPIDFEGLILVGGISWRTEGAKKIKPLVETAVKNNRVLGAICDASVFAGSIGVLNNVKHTSNDLNDLKSYAGEAYTNEENYIKEPAVRDKKIVTANGTATLEFAKEMLLALNIAPEEKVNEWYNFHKEGFYKAPMPQM